MKRILMPIVFYLLLENTLNAQTNTFPSSGNVGVGTTSPLTPMHVIGGSTMTGGWNKTSTLQATFPVQLYNSNSTKWGGIGYDYSTGMQFWVNGSSEDLHGTGKLAFSISNNGHVGLGTYNPIQNMHLRAVNPIFLIENSTGVGGQSPAIIRLYNNNIGYNSKAGEIQFTPIQGAASVLSSIAGGWSNAIEKGFLSFSTSNDYGATLTEKMRVDDIGRVGIGTTSPSYKLEAVTGGRVGFRLQTSASNVGNPQIDLYDASSGQETVISSTDGVRTGTYLASYSNHPLLFGTNHSQAQMMLATTGNVGIGTTDPGTYKLAVEGTIGARKLKVTQSSWADDVFKKNYKLRPISEVEKYIQQHGHLPEVPSEKEVKGKDLDISETQTMLLRKIEELTLYMIEQNKKINYLLAENKKLKKHKK